MLLDALSHIRAMVIEEKVVKHRYPGKGNSANHCQRTRRHVGGFSKRIRGKKAPI